MRSITKSVGCLTLWALVVYLFVKGALVLVPRKFTLAISALIAALVHLCSGSQALPASSSSGAPPSADGGRALEEGHEGDLVREREGHKGAEGGVRLAAFDHAEVLGVDGGSLGGLLLRQPLLLPDRTQAEPQTLSSPLDGPLDRGPCPDLGRAMRSIGR